MDAEGNLSSAASMQKTAAAKDQAAYLIYNALPDIKAANDKKEPAQGTDKDTTANIPNFGSFTFASGSFNSDIK